MKTRGYRREYIEATAVLFTVLAIGHALRLFLGLPIEVGSTVLPMWVSWLGVAVTGILAVWGFRAATLKKSRDVLPYDRIIQHVQPR